MEFYALALLPLALASLFDKNRSRSTAGFSFLAALAPVIAKGIGNLIGSKQKKAAAKQAEEQKKLEAQQADALAKQQWEGQQNSPAAQATRFKNTLQLGRLAGGLGGLDKVPKSMTDYYNTARTMPTYSAQSSYVPTAKKGGGVWDFLGGVGDALSYLDIGGKDGGKGMDLSGLRQDGATAPAQQSQGGGFVDYLSRIKTAGNQAAHQGGLGAVQSNPIAKNPWG